MAKKQESYGVFEKKGESPRAATSQRAAVQLRFDGWTERQEEPEPVAATRGADEPTKSTAKANETTKK